MGNLMPSGVKPVLKRNGFDLSERRLFTMPVGQLLPTYCLEVNPGEQVRVRLDDFIRTQTLNTAAFGRVKVYHNAFFVPYHLLWNKSDLFFTQTKNATSTYHLDDEGKVADVKTVPYFHLRMLQEVLESFRDEKLKTKDNPYGLKKDIFGLYVESSARRLLEMLGYPYSVPCKGFYQAADSPFKGAASKPQMVMTSDNLQFSLFRLLAYNLIFNDHFRNQYYQRQNVLSFSADWFNPTSTSFDEDMTACLQNALIPRYKLWSKDIFTSSIPTPFLGKEVLNSFLTNDGYASYKISGNIKTYIDSGNGASAVGLANESSDMVVPLQSLRMAYALERLSNRTQFAKGMSYEEQIESHFGFDVPKGRLYRSLRIGSAEQTISIGEVVSNSDTFDNKGNIVSKVGDLAGRGVSSFSENLVNFEAPEHGLIMVISVVEPYVEYDPTCDVFNEKLYREDYFIPEYDELGLQPVKQSSIFDPLLFPAKGYGVAVSESIGGSKMTKVLANRNRVVGFNVRYNEYKTSFDKVFGPFRNNGSLSAWCSARRFTDLYDVLAYKDKYSSSFDGIPFHPEDTTPAVPDANGKYDFGDRRRIPQPANYFGTLTGLEQFDLNERFLCINPRSLDSLFAVSYDGTPDTDNFLCNFYFDVKVVRSMSVSGIQNL